MTGRYEAMVATFIGALALMVSAYTAYVQRQQVRAQVIPILQFGTANAPFVRITVDNKGVGPAIVKHVVITADGVPMKRWRDVMVKLLGPGKHPFEEADIGSAILAPNETITLFKPYDQKGGPLVLGPPGSEAALLDEARNRIGIEICYCSTLGDCWTMREGANEPGTTTDVRRCPAPSERTFLE